NYNELEEIDWWLLSKYNKLVKYTTAAMEEYDLNKAVRLINNFVNEELSNWYIRRNRRRFWKGQLDTSKKAVYQTTYEVLTGICKLIAPIAPFLVDEIYKNLTQEESVHLADYPICNEAYIQEQIEHRMDLVRDLISLGRNAREEAKIKVRQPIGEIILDGKVEDVISDMVDLIKEELNVKEVIFAKDLSNYMNYEVKPNFKICGKLFGANIKEFGQKLSTLEADKITKLDNGDTIKMEINLEEVEITPEMVEIRVSSKEGFNASNEGSNFIVLNTTLSQDLREEGICREFISKIQNLRKSKNFEITDRIHIYYKENEKFTNAIQNYIELIKEETLTISIEVKDNQGETYDINGLEVVFDVEKAQ
ncbi:MAG: class I tRNA ligase family protein, partial [Bacilli bacterium]|nr:class I tRNA ligase family protein [Bacilli bacterium]